MEIHVRKKLTQEQNIRDGALNKMKKVSLLFIISFFFFVKGQILWSIRLFNQHPVFSDGYTDDWVVNIMFSLCSIFGLIGSYNWYKQNNSP